MTRIFEAFSLTWPVAMQIYWNKRNTLIHKQKVLLPQTGYEQQDDHHFIVLDQPIWWTLDHVKTLYTVTELHTLSSSSKVSLKSYRKVFGRNSWVFFFHSLLNGATMLGRIAFSTRLL